MSPIIVDRFRSAFRDLRRRRNTGASDAEQFIWQSRLPASVFVAIVAQCELADIYSLSLACHVLHRRISQLEYSIALEYLHRRKRRRRSNVDEASVSPGDDLTFISDLFPPPPPQYTNETQDDRPEYSFGYLADLTRCWTTCIRLSYYLADYAVHNHLQTDPVAQALWSSSKIEKDYIYTKAVSFLQSRLLRPIAYLIFFLESYASSPPTPAPKDMQLQTTLQTQQYIVQRYPFTDTQVLLSTHHCMHLLCSSVRRMMAPDIAYASTENWLSLLLTTSTLERIAEFFTAAAADRDEKEATGSTSIISGRRVEFMLRMRKDLDEYLLLKKGGASGTLRLRDIWFDAAERELYRRDAIPHDREEVPVIHGSGVMLQCRFCEDSQSRTRRSTDIDITATDELFGNLLRATQNTCLPPYCSSTLSLSLISLFPVILPKTSLSVFIQNAKSNIPTPEMPPTTP